MTARVAGPTYQEVFAPARRAVTVGLLLLMSMVAFETMGVSTAMPAVAASLGAQQVYAWPFVAYIAAGVVGTVAGGRWCDRSSPRTALVAAPVLFGAGLLVAGSATGIPQLLVGRVAQGLGAGALTVAIYVLIALMYSEHVRPAMFGLMSAAWVLPALAGPPVSGLVAECWSWRWVFLGLVPLVLVALTLVVPAVHRLGRPDPNGFPAPKRPGLMPAAFGAAGGVSALSIASDHPGLITAGVALAALAVLVLSMRRLLPAGVLRARRGVPAVVACRGLCSALFLTPCSYLPLMLTSTHHWPLAAAGAPLMAGSLGWTSASGWQGRHPHLARTALLRVGFCLLTAGAVGLQLVAPSWGVAWLVLPLWAIGGVGMGLCFPAVGYLLQCQSHPAELGFHTSAAQMCDQLSTATMIGVGGALLALLGSPSTALPVLLAVLTVLGALGVLLVNRTAEPPLPVPGELAERRY